MTNTVKQQKLELVISLIEPDTDFMKQLSATTGDFSFLLQASPNDVIKSTGMVTIPSGMITVEDVGMVHSAAMPPENNDEIILLASTTCQYLIDGRVETELMPIGIHGNKLQATISMVRVQREKLRRWFDWPAALERNLIGWRIEIVPHKSELT